MSLQLYFDVNIRREIVDALRLRGVDVITAQEDAAAEFVDPALLDRAGALGRILFTHDTDFLEEAATRQRSGEWFVGIVYAHPLNVTITQCVDDLELICKVCDPGDFANHVEFLPLK